MTWRRSVAVREPRTLAEQAAATSGVGPLDVAGLLVALDRGRPPLGPWVWAGPGPEPEASLASLPYELVVGRPGRAGRQVVWESMWREACGEPEVNDAEAGAA